MVPEQWSEAAPMEHSKIVVVELDDAAPRGDAAAVTAFGPPSVVVGIAADPASSAVECDLVLGADELHLLDDVVGTVERNPVASAALVALLRSGPGSVAAGLVAESATYAALQSGEEFRRWRAARRRRDVVGDERPVNARREGDVLHLTLHRPARRNALDASMRDSLAELLGLALADPTIRSIVLDGSGPAFCSGGDLDEFGTAPDPATAHLVRLERNLGALIHAVADRLTVHLHGAAIGSGIELAAFAHRVLAAPDVVIALPELAMGLIPGAGGTVSLTRRIGRHRLCRMALTGERVGLRRALEWGLVDAELST